MAQEQDVPMGKVADIADVPKKRKVIIVQDQSPGDILTLTRALTDLHLTYPEWEIDIRSPAGAIFENCPFLTPLKEDDPDVEQFRITYDEIHNSGWKGLHFADAFRLDMEMKLGVPITQTGLKPDLWLSDEEKLWFNQVHCDFLWDGPFWLLNAGRKDDNELKQYHRWQEVVDLLNEFFQGKVKIVQIGHKGSSYLPHHHPELEGVLSLVGKTDMRQLIRLAYWSEGTIGPLSFQFVLAGALEKPHVVLAAGKEGVRWHLYPHGRYIYTNGAMNCCKWDGCWLGGEKGQCVDLVDGVPKCFVMIKPHMVADAVKMYYEGGVLQIPEEEKWVQQKEEATG
jgi:ADP-heptose:LPS heptosyltransferase